MKEKAAVGCGEDEVHVSEKLQSNGCVANKELKDSKKKLTYDGEKRVSRCSGCRKQVDGWLAKQRVESDCGGEWNSYSDGDGNRRNCGGDDSGL
ncbi:hypothetical protein E3N88_10270 [Mikania micrantha]|uniref:Uncharacterized protein n=1 Tax=Mikania micrantha TaxID=192012 RepID=A0A5N6PBA6_9ASTR|nr:hypothetical protein E3N88_10270 [Mikania micrantha]